MTSKTTTRILFWTALISSWLTFLFFFTAIPGLVFWLVAVVIIWMNKSKLGWFLIVFSSWTFIPVFSFTFGTRDYFTGTATFRYVGLPGPEFYNLDADYRAWNSSTGCVVFGFEPLLNWPNNVAIRLWTKVFGFQRSVYTGFYPDKNAAEKLLYEEGKVTTVSGKDDSLIFKVGGRTIAIKDGIRYRDSRIQLATAKAVVGNELIVLNAIQDRDQEVTYLADAKTKTVFAKYYTKNENDD